MPVEKLIRKVKKFSTLLEILHDNIDFEKFYITVYKPRDQNGQITRETHIIVRPIQEIPGNLNHFTIPFTEGCEYNFDIPVYYLKPMTMVSNMYLNNHANHQVLQWGNIPRKNKQIRSW